MWIITSDAHVLLESRMHLDESNDTTQIQVYRQEIVNQWLFLRSNFCQ